MAFYNITYSKAFRRAILHNHGCPLRCKWCSYKISGRKEPDRFLSIPRIKEVLSGLDIDRVHFIGGEPTTCSQLEEVARYCKEELGVYTKIGHSACVRMPPENIDAITTSIKCISDDIHIENTGVSNKAILQNFRDCCEKGLEVDSSSVLIPNLIDVGEVERVARFIADISSEIPFHLIGYIPIPNSPWPRPTRDEMEEALKAVRSHLKHVTYSHMDAEDFRNSKREDIRYQSISVC